LNRTKIEWAKNPDGTQGYTWNPITGCLNGCEYCYARKLANTRLKNVYTKNDNYAYDAYGNLFNCSLKEARENPFYPRFWQDRLYHPWGGKPRGIFVCDMSDLFGIGIPEEWTEKVLNLCRLHEQNRYYLLTKQPQNLIKFSPFPDNCYVGVSATNWLMFSDALGHLASIQAKVKYISFEPLLERIQLDMLQQMLFPRVISWVIIGSQTKPYKPPKIEWVKEIVEACDKAGIPVFLKDNLKPLLGDKPDYWDYHTGKWLRQELPNG